MHILVTGGTGFVGKRVVRKLLLSGHRVTVSTRQAKRNESSPARFVQVNPESDWPAECFQSEHGPIDGVINLMGENIAEGRWNDKRKQAIYNSRIKATQKLIEGILRYAPNISFFSQASAIGFYPVNRSEEMTEDMQANDTFLAKVCQDWESRIINSPLQCRRIISRIGVVFGRDGGALAKLLPIFNLGAGGPIGLGSMSMSWIHVDDLAAWFEQTATNSKLTGVYNAVSGHCTNKDMTKSLAKALRRPALFPVPPFMLNLIFGEMSCIMLDSQKISNARMRNSGFNWQYPTLDSAMNEVAGNKVIIDGQQPHRVLEDLTLIEKKK